MWTPIGPPQRPLTQENLAASLLRFLGLYFTAWGAVSAIAGAGHLFLLSTRHGIDDALRRYGLDDWIRPGVELIIGLYFLLGGQWVYDKILTPVGRRFSDDDFPECEEDGGVENVEECGRRVHRKGEIHSVDGRNGPSSQGRRQHDHRGAIDVVGRRLGLGGTA